MERIGKYEVLEKIGTGGFGVVFKGYDPFIKRPVAIKTCFSSDETVRQRFFREAEIAGRLQHRNITSIFDSGFHRDVPFLVVEYLDGEDLQAKIKRREPLELKRKLRVLIDVATGLESAHGEGVIHRDIKPGNIRVLSDGTVKIMDFGTAVLSDSESSLTQSGVTIGTVAYLSPEQIEGQKVGTNSDIFSFGTLAYELISLQRPFGGKKISEIILKILEASPPRLGEIVEGCPAALEAAVHRCLERDPESRYQSCTPLIADLETVHAALGDGHEVRPAPLVTPSGPSVDELLTAARSLLEQRDYEKVEALLRQVLGEAPEHPEAIRLLRTLEQDRKEQTLAGRRLQGIQEAAGMVEDLISRGKFDGALKAIDFAANLFGDFAEAAPLREQVEKARDKARLEQERQQRRRVDSLLSEARLRLRQLLAEDAHRHLSDALRLAPGHPQASRLLQEADALLAQGSSPRDNAIRDAVQAIGGFLDGGDTEQAERALEFARHRLGDFPEARELRSRIASAKREATRVSQSIDTLEDVDSFLFLARELLELGERDGALRALRRVLRLNPEHHAAQLLLQELRERTG